MRIVPYRPSNGTEGEFFYHNWCEHCGKELISVDPLDYSGACEILTRTMFFEIGDPEYPKEWVAELDDDTGYEEPKCTAFQKRG